MSLVLGFSNFSYNFYFHLESIQSMFFTSKSYEGFLDFKNCLLNFIASRLYDQYDISLRIWCTSFMNYYVFGFLTYYECMLLKGYAFPLWWVSCSVCILWERLVIDTVLILYNHTYFLSVWPINYVGQCTVSPIIMVDLFISSYNFNNFTLYILRL